MVKFTLNGKSVKVDVPDDTPLLWVIREELGLRGTKYSCGEGLCGCCTVHLDGEAVTSCNLAVKSVEGASVTTIEGILKNELHPVQKAWIKNSVPQCGYCQPGQVMQAVSILENAKKVTKKELIEGMDGNLCRCGTYNLIKKALFEAAKEMGKLK